MSDIEIGWHAAMAVVQLELEAMKAPAVGDDLDVGSVMNRAHNRALTIARERIAHLRPEAVLSSGV